MGQPYDASQASGLTRHKTIKYEGKPRWQKLRTKRGENFIAHLMVSRVYRVWGVGIERPNSTEIFVGLATFPNTMGRQAAKRFDELNNDQDIEGLLREFGTDEQYLDFMSFQIEDENNDSET